MITATVSRRHLIADGKWTTERARITYEGRVASVDATGRAHKQQAAVTSVTSGVLIIRIPTNYILGYVQDMRLLAPSVNIYFP